VRERFFVELAPGYVRLRHQLGYRTPFGRRRLCIFEKMIVEAMEQADLASEPLEIGPPEDSDDYLELVAADEAARQEAEEEFFASLSPWEAVECLEARDIEAAKKAAEARLGRGAKGMSERSRREMSRWVLSLPFEMLGERPLWITLTYPGDWRRWVPDGPTLERHRRASGQAWYRGFGERPVGFWSKEFQLAEGRPHLHLLMRGPDSIPDAD
jgi:hypothetical protein